MELSMSSVRWAVNCASWLPTKHEWLRALSCVQPEETERVLTFVHARDAKSALVGRLLLRSVLVKLLGVENAELILGRSDKGRPLLVEPQNSREGMVDFNVSHQGSFAVLAAERGRRVGVDLMQFTKPRGQTLSDFFHTMRRQFTDAEWRSIRRHESEQEQLSWFYRFWCLKESFIKAEGSGLSYGLQRLEFHPTSPWPPASGEVVVGTQVAIDGQRNGGWQFQESLVDAEHCVSVAVGPFEEELTCGLIPPSPMPFTARTVPELIDIVSPLHTQGEEAWQKFLDMH